MDAEHRLFHEQILRLLLNMFEYYQSNYIEQKALVEERIESEQGVGDSWYAYFVLELMVRWASWDHSTYPHMIAIGEGFDRDIGAKPDLYAAWDEFLRNYFLENPEVITVWLKYFPVEEAAIWAYERLNHHLADQHNIIGFIPLSGNPNLLQ